MVEAQLDSLPYRFILGWWLSKDIIVRVMSRIGVVRQPAPGAPPAGRSSIANPTNLDDVIQEPSRHDAPGPMHATRLVTTRHSYTTARIRYRESLTTFRSR